MSRQFLAAGAKVVAVDRLDDHLDGTIYIPADVTDEDSLSNMAEQVVKQFGHIDIWVNNAGIWLPHIAAEDMDMKRVRQMVDVNLFGTMHGSRVAIRQMKTQGYGTIVNILSTSALQGRALSSGYCASKYAATGFTNSIRKEVEERGIRVFSIYPGGMQTTFFDEEPPANIHEYMPPQYVAEKIIAHLQQSNPADELIIQRPTA